MKQVYQFRKKDNPALAGLEAVTMVVSGQISDKKEHNKLLEDILKQLPDRKLGRETGVRLMTILAVKMMIFLSWKW